MREIKFARNRLNLLRALIGRLETVSFDDIKIKDLCRDVQLSEATFFNYFPKKSDLLYYFIQLWSIDVQFQVINSRVRSAYEKLQIVFTFTARESGKNPRIMGEIIAFQARVTEPPEIPPLSGLERDLAFPDRTGIAEMADRGLDSILPSIIAEALERKELPSDVDAEMLGVGLASIFFGVPLIFSINSSAELLEKYYIGQLEIFWRGAGGKFPKEKRQR